MRQNDLKTILKAPTGIEGFDEISRGGLPTGRVTLVAGGPGSGKTIFALQTLVNGARLRKEPGIFVAFEENSQRIMANAAAFGWGLEKLQPKGLFFLDAKQEPDQVQADGFDLSGLLAVLQSQARKMGAKQIVFDSVDVLLRLLNDPVAERRELYRLHEWLLAQGLTAILTSKVQPEQPGAADGPPMSAMQFMVDCVVAMNHTLAQGVSQRSLRVVKYRGSSFSENESPMVIGERGISVAGERRLSWEPAKVSSEMVSSGVARFDAMLGGGYYRGAGVLITGAPGTAKTTLLGAFAEAACRRGERTVFVSFDSDPAEIMRNLASVNIRLARFAKQGLLAFEYARSGMCSAEVQLMRIKDLVRAHRARNLVIDPVSALAKQGNELTAHSVVERLTDWAKAEGITLVCSSLLDSASPAAEGTPLQISTIADTWIHLSYVIHAGERNRAITIIKSRGVAHSNQVRELVLKDSGVTLVDVYSAGGEVLMGTLRWEKEQSVRAAQQRLNAEARQKMAALQLDEDELAVRLKALERELAAKQAERKALIAAEADRKTKQSADQAGILRHRQPVEEEPIQ
jgi:circadian clock protein KaiC